MKQDGTIGGLSGGATPRGLALLGAVGLAALAAPWLLNDFLLSVLIVTLYFAYTGQAWNVMMGFAGQLSLGHALYVGLAAYATAALFVHFQISPWIGLLAAIPVSVLSGALIGYLAFRFRISGVYFAILTIAFAEFARIGFDHFTWVGGSGGFFLPVAQASQQGFWNLRGSPIMFYYLILVMVAVAFLLCRALLASRTGYYWQAIREDEQAARALGIDTFRYKMIAVMISAGMTAPAGVFIAFYNNNLFPEQIFNISQSIEIILAPIIGGIGSLFGPIIGAFLLQWLAESLRVALDSFGVDVPGAKQVFFGVLLLAVVVAVPEGIWPWIAARFKLTERK